MAAYHKNRGRTRADAKMGMTRFEGRGVYTAVPGYVTVPMTTRMSSCRGLELTPALSV